MFVFNCWISVGVRPPICCVSEIKCQQNVKKKKERKKVHGLAELTLTASCLLDAASVIVSTQQPWAIEDASRVVSCAGKFLSCRHFRETDGRLPLWWRQAGKAGVISWVSALIWIQMLLFPRLPLRFPLKFTLISQSHIFTHRLSDGAASFIGKAQCNLQTGTEGRKKIYKIKSA